MTSILAISSELPWPLNSGGHLRTYHLLKSLATEFDVRLMVPTDGGDGLEQLPDSRVSVVRVPVASRTVTSEMIRAFHAIRLNEPYSLYRRHARTEMLNAWNLELQRFRPDVVYLDHLDSYLYEGPVRKMGIPAIIDMHNVYSLIPQRMASESSNPLKRMALTREARLLDRIERRLCGSKLTITAVSTAEVDTFRGLGAPDVLLVPNGVDTSAFQEIPIPRTITPPVILYLGTLSWGPNAAAAITLANEIFPAVRAVHSDARLLIVGKDPSADVIALSKQPGVTVTGAVPSIVPYFQQASVLAIPLDSGGGTRLKILEAFAAGVPVVSTPIGAEGIDAHDGEHLVLASRQEMSRAILDLLNDPTRATLLAENARNLVRNVYDWSQIAKTLVEKVKSILPRNAISSNPA